MTAAKPMKGIEFKYMRRQIRKRKVVKSKWGAA